MPSVFGDAKMTGSEDGAGVERLSADEIERVVLNILKERLADAGWLAEQIRARARDATKVADILRAIDRCRIYSDGPDDDALVQVLPGIIDRIDAKTDRLCISVNLAGMMGLDAADNPIVAAFEIPFQRHQKGRAKPIGIVAVDAPQQDRSS